MDNFVINGILYKPAPFSFNTVCDLEERGIALQKMREKSTSTLRAYFAICSGLDDETAGIQIEQHIISGGDMSDLVQAMTDAMSESDFFQALSKNAEKARPKRKGEKAKEIIAQ